MDQVLPWVIVVLFIVAVIIAATFVVMMPCWACKRFSKWPPRAGLLAAVAGAVLGFLDLGWFGAGVGAIVGGSVVYYGLGLVLGAIAVPLEFIRPRIGYDKHADSPPTMGTRVWAFLSQTGSLVVLGVLSFELFWAAHAGAFFSVHALGHQLADPRVPINNVNELRWQVDVLNIRPVRWLLLEDAVQAGRQGQEVISAVNSRYEGKLPVDSYWDKATYFTIVQPMAAAVRDEAFEQFLPFVRRMMIQRDLRLMILDWFSSKA